MTAKDASAVGLMQEANDALTDSAELRRRLDEQGYLFLRQIMAKDKLLSLRQEMTAVLMEAGWLVAGTDPMDGIAQIGAQCTEGDPEYAEVYHRVYRLEAFHQAGHWPEVLAVMAQIVGGPVLSHPQKIARLWFPQYTEHTTPMHQDFVHFQGSFNTYTFWAPVGDCPLELGGLAVLPRSHEIGKVREHHFSLGAGGLAVAESELSGRWLSANYEAGDALIFPSLTVHQALPNYTEDRLRISLDNRYQAPSEPIAQHMLEPHLTGVTGFSWEACYAGWQSKSLQYYWQDLDLEVVPQLSRWGDQGFAEALSLAHDGDERALYQLRRIARRDPESERGRQALQLLDEVNV